MTQSVLDVFPGGFFAALLDIIPSSTRLHLAERADARTTRLLPFLSKLCSSSAPILQLNLLEEMVLALAAVEVDLIYFHGNEKLQSFTITLLSLHNIHTYMHIGIIKTEAGNQDLCDSQNSWSQLY